MNNLQSIIDENKKMFLEIKELKKEISSLRIDKLQYDNLRKCFDDIIREVLGEDYYNMGADVYTCDILASEDIIKKINKNKKNTKIKHNSLCETETFIGLGGSL